MFNKFNLEIMATSDDRRLIDNESSTTVDKFYGNKGGKDVQISLDDAASVLAEASKSLFMIPTITDVTDFNLVTDIGIHGVDFYQKANSPFPSTYTGTLIVIRNSYGQFHQIALAASKICYRRRTSSGTWDEWLTISAT